MALFLSAEQRSIEQVFSAPEKYVIPVYQRPYSWEYEQCFQLYKDITSAFENNKNDYFIGNIIIAKSSTERMNRYVVDGQQRLITIWLFLRVANILYPELKILKKMTVTESREEGVEDELNIRSNVFERGDEQFLRDIFSITTQESLELRFRSFCNRYGRFVETKSENQLERNLIWFYIWLKNFKEKDDIRCKEFIFYVIDQVFLLPIELTGDSVDEANRKALIIFETINNRGMNLEDADIFKAKLYDKAVALKEEENFIRLWLDFRTAAEDMGLSVDDIFRYYSHIIRGKQKITSSETSLRELFIDADYSPLITKQYSEVMSDLLKIIECLRYIEFSQSAKNEISKWMQVIKAYSNQYPNFAVVSFLFINGYEQEESLIALLKSLIRYVYYTGSTTTVKFEIYNIVKKVCNDEPVDDYRTKRAADYQLSYHPRLRKGFALLAYYLQNGVPLSEFTYDKIITYKDTEDNNSFFYDERLQKSNYVEMIGNDIILDKPKKYIDWQEKRKYYSTSGITEVNDLIGETDILSLIEKRTEYAQSAFSKFFFCE